MSELRTTSEMMYEAHKLASRYAPLPAWRPVYGGFAGAAVAGVPMIIFADVDVGVSLYALVVTTAIGFALPFFWLKRRKDAYNRAHNQALEAIRVKIDAEAPKERIVLPTFLSPRR